MTFAKVLASLGVAVLLAVSAKIATAQTKASAHSMFVLSSSDSRLAAKVPEEYTANVFGCSGGNVLPELRWNGAPAEIKSFVLTLFDPDEHGDPSGPHS